MKLARRVQLLMLKNFPNMLQASGFAKYAKGNSSSQTAQNTSHDVPKASRAESILLMP